MSNLLERVYRFLVNPSKKKVETVPIEEYHKTKQVNQRNLRAINRLELPDYQARYDRLEVVARLHGRKWYPAFDLQLENFECDMEMLKI